MGNNPAPPAPPAPPPPRKTKTDQPWRKTQGWGSEVKRTLKKKCEKKVPQHGKHFNILLTGQIKSGKSSFYNSVCNMFKESITPMVHAGEASKSLTTKFRKLEVKPSPHCQPLSLRIYDSMGLEGNESQTDVRNLLAIIDGHVPDKYEFAGDKEFNISSKEYILIPKVEDKVHCVVFVIDANAATVMSEEMRKKIKFLKKKLVDRDIPVFVLLTKVDLICKHVSDDVQNVYHSIAVHDAVIHLANNVVAVPEYQVLPVVNYVKQDQLVDNMDVLLLNAIIKMIDAAQGNLEMNPPERKEASCCFF